MTIENLKSKANMNRLESLKRLGLNKGRYYRYMRERHQKNEYQPGQRFNINRILEEEKDKVVSYALNHTEYRYREMTYRMIDEGTVFMSESSVYRILKVSKLMFPRIVKRRKRTGRTGVWAKKPDECWQIDIMMLWIDGSFYNLLIFMDEYSRYIVHWKLLLFIDGITLSDNMEEALSKRKSKQIPMIQTDNGSGFIGAEFKKYINDHSLTHILINPGSPAENALIERGNRTIREEVEEKEPRTHEKALEVIEEVIDYYNNERYHSKLNFMPPVIYYIGNPAKILLERKVKILEARRNRREKNMNLRLRSQYDKSYPPYYEGQKVHFS